VVWRASNCLTTVNTTRPMTSQMPTFLSKLFNAIFQAPRAGFQHALPGMSLLAERQPTMCCPRPALIGQILALTGVARQTSAIVVVRQQLDETLAL
jgi:hypothetical protein